MSIEMTLSFVRAAVQRAEHHGNKTVELSVMDMLELLPRMESNLHHERADRKMKRAGWASPNSMKLMLGQKKGKRSIRMLRNKDPKHNLELFFCDKLSEKIADSEALVAKDESEARQKEATNGD
jgi:hypothetical protein